MNYFTNKDSSKKNNNSVNKMSSKTKAKSNDNNSQKSYKKIGDDEHCTKCIENYHFYMFETNGNCHNIPPYGKPNYFVNEDDYYQECYYRCLLCNELGDDRNNKCIKCNYEIGYYGVEDEPYKCLNQDEKNSNPKYTYYHIDMTDYIIKKCHYEEGYVLVDVDSKKHYVCILEPRVKIEYPSHAKDSDLYIKDVIKVVIIVQFWEMRKSINVLLVLKDLNSYYMKKLRF